MKHVFFVLWLIVETSLFCQTKSSLHLPSLIGDNMVLQQNTSVRVWGSASPGQHISINTTWKSMAESTTDSSGHWQTEISTPHAGGPYSIQVNSIDTSITLHNVLIGTVWICSGQSNMEMPLAGWFPAFVEHAKEAIDSCSTVPIRLFTVPKSLASSPSQTCTGSWQISSPNTVKNYSATAYFFGQKLYEKLHIPVGLILSAWGGTPIEGWMPASSLAGEKSFENDLIYIQHAAPEISAFMSWLNLQPHFSVDSNAGMNKWKDLSFHDSDCANSNFNDDQWPVAKLPQYLEQAIGDFDGTLWYRKKITLPEQMAGKKLKLSLGPIDDMDRVYVNGQLVGTHEEEGLWQLNRNYEIPADLMHTGLNTIAVRVVDYGGGGGIYGKPEQMNLAIMNDSIIPPIQLAGDWKFLPVAEYINNTFYLYDIPTRGFYAVHRPKSLTPGTPSILYNAMVNPLLNYHVQGVIWYQGEANVGRADQYARLLPLLIQSWRKGWNNGDLSFYVVQIAPFEYSGKNNVESAELKNAQASAFTLPHTGLVVTLDLGSQKNIHPPFKLEVGERLAACALANDFHLNIPYRGPTFKNLTRKNNSLIVEFDHTEGGLLVHGSQLREFEIAGSDTIYYPATAEIKNNTVIVSSPSVLIPVSVRYCWHNGSEASLFNKAGLPASLFMAKIN